MDWLVKPYVRLLLGPLSALCIYVFLQDSALSSPAIMVASITVLCAFWWILEPIPIPVTSLLPLALLPLLNILTPQQVAEAYGSPLILLLMGGFILSTSMEKSGAHRHIALFMVKLFGAHSARRVVFGFMAASASLSMWISNTATTLMLLPVALAVIGSAKDKSIATPLLLGICYSASIGGMGTPIGTPPNLIFMNVYEQTVGESISFATWMSWSIPIVVCFVPLVAIWLTRHLNIKDSFTLPEKTAWTINQKRVLMVFALTALAWITRTEPFGGWREWIGAPKANDASVALLAVISMFIIPSGNRDGKALLDWQTAAKIPWGILLLFSGGIALAKGFIVTGLAEHLAHGLTQLANLPIFITLLIICLSVTFLTEVTSNTASTSLLMPVLALAAISLNIDPVLFMVPAALSASCAFMLPVATAPNAVIYGSGLINIADMAKNGFIINLVGALVISLLLLRLA